MSEMPYKFQKPTDVPFQPTHEESAALTEQYKARTDAALNFSQYWTPQLPDVEAQEIYERLLEAERLSAAPNLRQAEYDDGVAREDDEMRLLDGSTAMLLTTEHATAQMRGYKTDRHRKGPEYGLAALGTVLHEDTGISHLTMLGRQTGDPNNDPRHPFKDEITRIVTDGSGKDVFTSLHGMVAGHVNELDDSRAIDVAIGIGVSPTDHTRELAEKTKGIADDLGLRAGINEPFITLESKDPLVPKLNPDGTVKRIRFGGGGNTTRQHAEDVGNDRLASLQIEYSSFLRLATVENKRDYKSRYIGAYMGYVLLRRMVEIAV